MTQSLSTIHIRTASEIQTALEATPDADPTEIGFRTTSEILTALEALPSADLARVYADLIADFPATDHGAYSLELDEDGNSVLDADDADILLQDTIVRRFLREHLPA